jgi:hypothetical protein
MIHLPAFEMSVGIDRRRGQTKKKAMNFLYQGFQRGLKADINAEKRLRGPWKGALDLVKTGEDPSIADWSAEKKKSFEENASMIIKMSMRKEKFLRYCYNLDLPKAEEYRLKVRETMLEQMDDAMESSKEGVEILFGNPGTDGFVNEKSGHRGEGAVIAMGKDMMEGDKQRQKVVEQVKCLIENGC